MNTNEKKRVLMVCDLVLQQGIQKFGEHDDERCLLCGNESHAWKHGYKPLTHSDNCACETIKRLKTYIEIGPM